jgi:hypothetical protein
MRVIKVCIATAIAVLFSKCIYFSSKDSSTHYSGLQRDLVISRKENLWVFILAGQSNMAGRAKIEALDTIAYPRVLTINSKGEVVFAKEPLHFYEPSMSGLGCGLAFGKALVSEIPDSISVLLVPTAVGGSSIIQWLGDSLHRGVRLLSNFEEKAMLAAKVGVLKGILWHQGESDADSSNHRFHRVRLQQLFGKFRSITKNPRMPVIVGELGSYSNSIFWPLINYQLRSYVSSDTNAAIVSTGDFWHTGDQVHFNSRSQRQLGERFAKKFVERFASCDYK